MASPFRFVLVAPERAPLLVPPLRHHLAGDPRVAVLAERRIHDGRPQPDSRAPIAIRDARLVLPPDLRAHVDAVRYVQRLAPVRRTFESLAVFELVDRCRNDPQAVSELWWRWHERALARLRARLADARAEPVMPALLGHVLDHLDEFPAGTDAFEAWLDAVADRFVAA